MSRRSNLKASETAKDRYLLRWRFLLRNSEFQRSLNNLRSQYPYKTAHCLEEFKREWGISDLPFNQVFRDERLPELSPSTLELYESVLDHATGWPGITEAVTFSDPYFEIYDYYDPQRDIQKYPLMLHEYGLAPGLKPNQKLTIEVDLSYPLDVLEAIVNSRLRLAVLTYKDIFLGRVERQNRLHTSTAAFQLQVYDLAMKGETFGSINRLLKKKPSTVKSGYLAAIAKIYGQSKSDRPVRTLALKSFDPTQHLKNCKTCQNANSIETMCTICQVFTKQDHCGLRELLSDGSAELS